MAPNIARSTVISTSAGHAEGFEANRTAIQEHAACVDGGTFVFNIWVRGTQSGGFWTVLIVVAVLVFKFST